MSFAYTLFSLIQAIAVPFAGALMDRFGARRVILPSLVLGSIVLLLAPFGSNSLFAFYAVFGVLGLLVPGAGPVAFAKVTSQWFDRRRGLALGVMMLGLGLGAFVMPSVGACADRPVWLASGIRGGGRRHPGGFGAAGREVSQGEPGESWAGVTSTAGRCRVRRGRLPSRRTRPPGMSWREALRTRTFWLLLTSFALISAAAQACFTHMTAIFVDRGSNAQLAALASSLLGGGLLIGRTGSGYLLDRFFAPRVATLIFTGAACGIALLRVVSSPGPAFGAAFLIGLALGAEGDVMPFLTSRYFGTSQLW